MLYQKSGGVYLVQKRYKKVTNEPSVFLEIFQMFMKGVCMIKPIIILKTNFRDINADFARDSIPEMHFFSRKKR